MVCRACCLVSGLAGSLYVLHIQEHQVTDLEGRGQLPLRIRMFKVLVLGIPILYLEMFMDVRQSGSGLLDAGFLGVVHTDPSLEINPWV